MGNHYKILEYESEAGRDVRKLDMACKTRFT